MTSKKMKATSKKKFKKGRRPQPKIGNEDDLKKNFKKMKMTSKKNEDDLKKNEYDLKNKLKWRLPQKKNLKKNKDDLKK
jgi:hypothetical protein